LTVFCQVLKHCQYVWFLQKLLEFNDTMQKLFLLIEVSDCAFMCQFSNQYSHCIEQLCWQFFRLSCIFI